MNVRLAIAIGMMLLMAAVVGGIMHLCGAPGAWPFAVLLTFVAGGCVLAEVWRDRS